MFVSPQFKTIFVHAPKCAGTSIRDIFQRADPHLIELRQHLRASEGQELLPQWQTFFRFGVCRHPFDQLASHYGHMTRDPHHQFYAVARKLTFSKWLRWYTLGPRPAVCAWYFDVWLDSVLHFETLEHDLRPLLRRLGIVQGALPHLNEAPRRPAEDLLTPDDKAYIMVHYRLDFERFGYAVEFQRNPSTRE